jgi:predicted HD phosphohydrolase
MSNSSSEPRAAFHAMTEGTQDDWMLIAGNALAFNKSLPARVIAHLKLLHGDFGGYAVDRLEHSVQTASRAFRDGRDEEYVVCALLHDIGDTLGSLNHADIGAAILKPFVSEQNLFMLEKHGIFQGYYFFEYLGLDKNMRDQYRDHPSYGYVAEFCEKYDQNSFDPKYESMPLEAFIPLVENVMQRPRRSIYMRDKA